MEYRIEYRIESFASWLGFWTFSPQAFDWHVLSLKNNIYFLFTICLLQNIQIYANIYYCSTFAVGHTIKYSGTVIVYEMFFLQFKITNFYLNII